ncbi:MAG: YfcE family phosphodiesterase [Planctomycetaceae bacterium]|nr:YfcE family phosphodiesterase [Planctomycetaceae bacterium]
MRILVLGDIHSNWQALSAIDEEFDACLVTGDLVDYGTDPLPCLDWVRRYANAVVRGNHDHAVAQRVTGRGGSGYRRLAAVVRPFHWDVLSPQHLKFLGRLPVTQYLQIGELRFCLVHATPRDPMDEYLGNDPEQWRQRLGGVDADFLCVGHSHLPFHLNLEGVQVLNPGSVGQPRDGDPRASYAIIEDGQVEMKRVAYDIDAAVAQTRASGLPNWVTRLNEAILTSGGVLSKAQMDAFV